MQSAATRNANARTAAIADSRVSPYAMTPGMDSMSAHQRPSSSRPTTIGMDSTVTVSIDFFGLFQSIIVPESSIQGSAPTVCLDFRNGKLYPNDRPGLGVELDMKQLKQVAEITQPVTNRAQTLFPPRRVDHQLVTGGGALFERQ